ncbi:MAG: aminopeptidase N [Coxiella sp. RIFCSPHIGHO2_12_FULL_42_15]|nr:MAG: aminopeptidase N [Coxiella sp. RIFCSPHIGHO2_12_FULL_42_15]
MSQRKPRTIYLKDYQPTDFLIDAIYLHVDLHEAVTEVKSILKCRRNPSAATSKAPLRLDGEAMTLKAVYLDGKAISEQDYQVDAVSLTLLHVPDEFTLETVVDIKPQENKALSGLYKSGPNFCTQCEAEGFRRITYFLDRPDVMTRFTTTITADKTRYPVLLSNGNLLEERSLSNHRHWVHWEDPSLKPAYLFALVAGDFDLLQDQLTTMSDRIIDLRLYLEKGYKDQGSFALNALKKAMRWDEEKFGREYDLDIYMIVAVSDFNMGAMENKGLNIFNTRYILAKPMTATDNDYIAIESVIGHEYFHNWTGNRITCRDWFQLTLKEGLTVFRDEIFTEDMTSVGVARIDTSNVVRHLQFPEDAGPMAHPIRPASYMEINNFYTNTVYRKGAEVIRMIRTIIGETSFRKAMDLYFERHDGQAVTTEDFVQAMQDASQIDLSQFRRWYDQAGTPQLEIEGDYDETQQTFTLSVTQSCPATPGQKEKLPFHIPLAVGLISNQCQDMPSQLMGEQVAQSGTRILEIKNPKQVFTFVNVQEKPIPSLLRNFSAPVKLNYQYSDDELLCLLHGDSDPFARYEASQHYFCRLIFVLMDRLQRGEDLVMDNRLIDVYQKMVANEQQDMQFLARLVTIPGLNYLLQKKTPLDLELAQTAREYIQKSLAVCLSAEWLMHYERASSKEYQFTMVEVGQRAIKNVALSYLTATKEKKFYQMAFLQHEKANNMTDAMGALLALNDQDGEYREKALQQFYDQWQQQPLVVNKWLLLHAVSTLPSTLAQVKHYMTHPAFDIMNPNKVYSLLGGFGSNLLRFHEKNGAGYAFLTDQVLKIDPSNPQVAARILQPLTRWGQVDEERQKLMKQQLARILKAEKLSSDVYEMAQKSLVQ